MADNFSFLTEYRYKIELHAHSKPASSCSDLVPERLLQLLAEQHYDAFVLTNHFHQGETFMSAPDPVGRYLDDYRACCDAAVKYGIRVYLGAEYRFTESNNDYLLYGVDEAFLRETVTCFPMTYVDFYRQYHRENIVMVQAHPMRSGLIPQPPECLDGIEAFNMHPKHNSAVAISAKWAVACGTKIITAGTDLHHEGHQGSAALRAKELPENNQALVKLLRSQDYLLDIGGIPVLPFGRFDH